MPPVNTLDEIRAEIAGKKQKINFKGLDSYEKAQAETRLSTLNELLQIIDKYEAKPKDIDAMEHCNNEYDEER